MRVFFAYIFLILSYFPAVALADESDILPVIEEILEDSASIDELVGVLNQDVAPSKQDSIRVIRCSFTCLKPIISCYGWTPPPGHYVKEITAKASDADKACEATTDATCKRCGAGGLSSYWFTTYKSVRWR